MLRVGGDPGGRVIGWYVHDHGRGHAARAAAVAAELDEPVTGLGSGPPPDGWRGPWVRLARDDDGVRAGTAGADRTAHGRLHFVPRHDAGLARRAAEVAAWAADARPTLLVVDVSVEVAVLARLCGVPVVVTVLPGERLDEAHRLAHDLADALLCPWPAGTHDAGWPPAWREKAWTVGGLSRFDGRPVRPPARRDAPRALLLWGEGGRSTTDEHVAAAQAATPGWDWVRARGLDEDALWEALLDADVVVTHAGQNAVAEVAAAARPAVVVAQTRPFDEQLGTARALEREGIAVGLETWPEAAAWPTVLARAVALGGSGWHRWSTGRGAAHVADRLAALATDLRGEAVPR